jgi:hypothetical protein
LTGLRTSGAAHPFHPPTNIERIRMSEETHHVIAHHVAAPAAPSWQGNRTMKKTLVIATLLLTTTAQAQIAGGKAKKEAETKKSLAELLQKRDPSDMVAQILNYAFTGKEHGLEGDDGNFGGSYYYPQWVFFIKESKCVYRRIVFTQHDELVRRQDVIIDLGKYDPRLFTFKERQDRDDDGNWVTKYELLYDGKAWNSTVRPLSIERLRRGWPLIYSKYCTGSQAPF